MDIHFTMISLGLRNLSNYDTIRAIEHIKKGEIIMERIKTLDTRDLCESAKNGGCGECQTRQAAELLIRSVRTSLRSSLPVKLGSLQN